MKKNLIKSICLMVAIVLIGNLIRPSFAGLSDFDNDSFMTKAEFDSAFSNIHSDVMSLKADINNKIDSQVASSIGKCLDVKQSGYIGELLFGLTLRDNCLPLYDDTKEYKKTDYPDLYVTMSSDTNLSKLLIAGSTDAYFKLEDISDRYAKFGDMANAGELGDESLPNILGYNSSGYPGPVSANFQGAFYDGGWTGYGYQGYGSGSNYMHFDASRGQVAAGGGYVSPANSTYKNGAKVNPDNIVVLPMIRYKIDNVQVDNKECPYGIGDIYQTTSSTDPATIWAGTTWERIVDGNYIQFVGDGEESKKQLDPELPNIKGYLADNRETGLLRSKDNARTSGPFGVGSSRLGFSINGWTNSDGYDITFDASKANSIYKDDGKVQLKSITAYGWIRIS